MSTPWTPEELSQRVADFLTARTGQPVTIHNARPLAGGASRDTWMFEAAIGGQPYACVMRRDLPTQMYEQALTREQEYRLMDAAYHSGVKVARVRYLCDDPDVLGSPFFIMDYVPGISIGRKVMQLPELTDARRRLPQQMAVQLARIHQIDTTAHDLGFLPRPPADTSPARHTVAEMIAILDRLGVHSPAWEWALRWAERHAPQPEALTFVHGDFRIGNLLVDESGLNAVIDWEFGHIGDPDEEIGYACMRDWRFGRGDRRFAGLCDLETFLGYYEDASGRQVDRRAVAWWEIMGNIRWGIICMAQADRHLSGAEQSVELASLGRRSAEMQLETLRLIETAGF